MKNKELIPHKFQLYLDNILEGIENTLKRKSNEYVRNEDKMHNFNVGAQKTNQIRERVLRGMRLKHDISVDDILNDIEKNELPSKSVVYEKYGDIINYNILEMISILHKIDEKNKEINECRTDK